MRVDETQSLIANGFPLSITHTTLLGVPVVMQYHKVLSHIGALGTEHWVGEQHRYPLPAISGGYTPTVPSANLIVLDNMAVLASQVPTTASPTTLLAEQAAEPGKLGLSLIMQAY